MQMDELSAKAEKQLGKKNVAPDYPPEIKLSGINETRTTDSYPFSVKNVKRFCEFLKECGGFKVC